MWATSKAEINEFFNPQELKDKDPFDVVEDKLKKAGFTMDQKMLAREVTALITPTSVYERLMQGIDVDISENEIAETTFDPFAHLKPSNGEPIAKIKLLFVDLGETNAIFNTLLKIVRVYPDYGRIHTALAIGPKIVEFNDSSLCIPRDCKSGKAILAIDIGELRGNEIATALRKLATEIVRYNTQEKYNNIHNNCQMFVDNCLKVMDVKKEFKGAVGNYVETVRRVGHCTMSIQLNKQMQDLLGEEILQQYHVHDGKLDFETHRELDNFCFAVKYKHPRFFDNDNPNEEQKEMNHLLKAFDRGFWLKFRRVECDDNKPCANGCFFGDPSFTPTAWKPTTRTVKGLETSNTASSTATTNPTTEQKSWWWPF